MRQLVNQINPTDLHLDIVSEAILDLKMTGLLKLVISLLNNTENRRYQSIINSEITANFILLKLIRKLTFTLIYKNSAKVLKVNSEKITQAEQA